MKAHQLDRSVLRLLGVALLLALLCLAVACAVNPVTGQQELAFMSESQELAMGQQNYPLTTQQSGGVVPDDARLQNYVNQVGRRLASTSHRPGMPWEFNVVNDSEINAYALPGGKISITRGLITKMRTEDELASVLGHEVGHVTARHAVRSHANTTILQGLMLGVGIALSGTGYEDVGNMAGNMLGGLALMSYSRDQEREADDLGWQYMLRQNYNPQGQVKAFEIFARLDQSEPDLISTMMRTHPLTSERIEASRQRVAQSPPNLVNQPLKTQAFKQILATQERRAPAYEHMDQGDQLVARKQYQAAINQYQQAADIFGGEGWFHTKMAMAYDKMDRKQAAQRAAAQGARLSPGVYMPQAFAGVATMEIGRYREALQAFDRAERIITGVPFVTLAQGYCLENLGQRQQAAQHYAKVYRSDPQSDEGQFAAKRLKGLGYQLQ